MKKKESFFMQLDQWLFQQVDKLQVSPVMNKWNELVAHLDETQQKILHQVLSLGFTFMPILLMLLVSISNCSMKNDIRTKKEIIREIDRLSSSKEQYDQISRPILAAVTLSEQSILNQRLKIHLDRDGTDMGNISITEFNTFPLSTTLIQTQATINFNSFTLSDFTNLLTSLLQKEKMVIVDIDVSKDEKNELLKGALVINSFGKSGTADER